MKLTTLPNERPGCCTWIENRIALPRCCPVSRNPQPGSVLRVRYRPEARVLEIYSFAGYIQEFRGGHPDGVRNMETMIQQIALHCAALLGVEVFARADLELMPCQQMTIRCRACPADDLLSRDPHA